MSAIQYRISKKLIAIILTVVLIAALMPEAFAATFLRNGNYTITVNVYKEGTTEVSRSASSVKTPATLVVSDGSIQAQVAFKNSSLTDITVGGVAASVVSTDVDWTTYQFPVESENAIVTVTVTVPAMGSKATLDLSFKGSTAALVTTAGASFVDVKSTDWYYAAVSYVVQHNLFDGTSKTTFSPDAPMTRSMLVTVLHRLAGNPAVTETVDFSDVKRGEWYTNAVVWANANNIAGGYGNGLFGTNESVTREQLALILYNYAKYKHYDITASADLSAYSDAEDISSWALPAMKWAHAEGFITAQTSTTLMPKGNSSRAEVATFLMRFCVKLVA